MPKTHDVVIRVKVIVENTTAQDELEEARESILELERILHNAKLQIGILQNSAQVESNKQNWMVEG